LRILDIGYYDMVLGMDWLESIGDMNVNWVQKSLHFQHAGHPVTLQGLSSVPSSTCSSISLAQLQAMEKTNFVLHLVAVCTAEATLDQTRPPPAVQHLLEEFTEVFLEPTSLPAAKDWDHHIPLIPGARPVSARTVIH
jgi:hypothetical protein